MKRQNQMRRWGGLLLTLLALVLLTCGSAKVQAAKLDHEEKLFTANSKNLVNQVRYEVLSSGKVQVTMTLNTAYAGAGRTQWTMYVIYTDANEESQVYKQSFDDVGISTNTTQTLKMSFAQGTAVLFGAYTDVTARNSWKDTSDYLELMENAAQNVDAIPSLPTDPKETAKTIKTKDKWSTYKKTIELEGDGKFYVKVKVNKDTWVQWKTFKEEWGGTNLFDLHVGAVIYPVDEKEPTSYPSKAKGDESVWLPGTYWLCFRNPSGTPVKLTVKFRYRHFVPIEGIEWTVDGKKVEGEIADVRGAGSTVKGVLLPKNTDGYFRPDEVGSEYKGVTNVVLSKDKKSFTAKIPQSFLDGEGEITAEAYDRYVPHVSDGTVYKRLVLAVGRPYSGGSPGVNSGELTVLHNSMTYKPKVFDTNLKLRIRMKSGSKWKTAYSGSAAAGATVKLKKNKKYTFRFDYFYQKNGKRYGTTKATNVTLRTGTNTKPVIRSVSVSNLKRKESKVEGHWIPGTIWYTWAPARTDIYYSYNLKVTLSKPAPAGVLGLQMTNQNVTSGNANTRAKVSGDRKTFTFTCSSAGNINATFRFYSDDKFGGYSPLSKVKAVKIK